MIDDDRETLFSNLSQKVSYGTIDLGKNPKRFWLRTPEGKLVYAHNVSEPDSYMERISGTGIIANFGRRTQVPNALENYFRAIDFIEHNIDFPLDSEDDPIELYSIHKHIFFWLTIIMFILNSASFYLGLQRKDTVVDSLIKADDSAGRSNFLSIFILSSLIVDLFIFTLWFLIWWFLYCYPKAKGFRIVSILAVISTVSVLFCCYIHQLYLLTFIWRILYYVYVRYVISILHTVLLMPSIRNDDQPAPLPPIQEEEIPLRNGENENRRTND